MADSGILWIDIIFDWAVIALVELARWLGITYEEINVWLFVIAWPIATFAMMVVILKLWQDKRMLVKTLSQMAAVFAVLAMSIAPQTASAGPSSEDMDYSVTRPLKVVTKVSNGIRFDVITPLAHTNVEGGQDSFWYTDELIVIRDLKTGKVLHAEHPASGNVTFVKSKKLSSDYVVIREWSGGASCCLIIHAYQTRPEFKKVLEHNNDFFDRTELVVGETTLELHKEPAINFGPSSHSQLKYNPAKFDLKTGKWD